MSAIDAYNDTDTDDVRVPFLAHWRGGMDHFRQIDARTACGLVAQGPLVSWTTLSEQRRYNPNPVKGNKGWMEKSAWQLSKRPFVPEPESRHWGKVK